MAPGVLESFRQSGSGAIRGNAPCPCRNSARAALRSSAAQRVPEMPQKEAARAEVGLGRPNSRLDIRKLVSYPLSRPGAKGRDVPPNPAAPLLKIQAEQHKMSKGSWWRRGASGSLAENGVFNAFVSSTAPSGPHLRRVTFNPACSPVKRPCFCAYLPFPLPFRSWTCWSTLDWCSGNTRTFAMFELSAYCLPRACPVSYSLPFPSPARVLHPGKTGQLR